MSSKNKKKTAPAVRNNKVKKSVSLKPLIIAAVLVAVAAAAVVATVIIGSNIPEQVAGTSWVSASASNSADEAVELSEIYNVYYSNYKGTLDFKDDGKFELWLTPGDPADGKHSGTYTVDGDVIKADFEGGSPAEFKIERDGKKIKSILVNYGEYKVVFERQKADEK